MSNNQIPGISLTSIYNNPALVSPNSSFILPFYETRETLFDTETYEDFLKNAISRFRKSRTYKHYKSFLMNLGLDRCQFMGNITSEMATIEMHHNMLTIFDIALIITEHILNTQGMISTFDLVMLLKQEHKNHRVQLTMLCKTAHQLYTNTDDIFIHPSMCIGNWMEFLNRYSTGITQDIAYKLVFYLNDAIKNDGSNDNGLLEARDKIMEWNKFNQCFR